MGSRGRRGELKGVFSATGTSEAIELWEDFNVSLWEDSGSPVPVIWLQRSPDGGATWHNVPSKAGGAYTGPAEERGFEPATGYLYRFNCTTLSGGNMGYEINN